MADLCDLILIASRLESRICICFSIKKLIASDGSGDPNLLSFLKWLESFSTKSPDLLWFLSAIPLNIQTYFFLVPSSFPSFLSFLSSKTPCCRLRGRIKERHPLRINRTGFVPFCVPQLFLASLFIHLLISRGEVNHNWFPYQCMVLPEPLSSLPLCHLHCVKSFFPERERMWKSSLKVARLGINQFFCPASDALWEKQFCFRPSTGAIMNFVTDSYGKPHRKENVRIIN